MTDRVQLLREGSSGPCGSATTPSSDFTTGARLRGPSEDSPRATTTSGPRTGSARARARTMSVPERPDPGFELGRIARGRDYLAERARGGSARGDGRCRFCRELGTDHGRSGQAPVTEGSGSLSRSPDPRAGPASISVLRFGKTEAWIFLDTPGDGLEPAYAGLGFKPGIDRGVVRRRRAPPRQHCNPRCPSPDRCSSRRGLRRKRRSAALSRAAAFVRGGPRTQ